VKKKRITERNTREERLQHEKGEGRSGSAPDEETARAPASTRASEEQKEEQEVSAATLRAHSHQGCYSSK